MKKIIPLIPLLEENKSEEILQHIKNGNFDPLEISENGRSLLAAAILLKKYNIADVLVQYSKNNNIIFDLNNQKYKNRSIIDDIIDDKDNLEGAYIFFKRHDLNINANAFDFLKNAKYAINNGLEKNQGHLSYFRKICDLNKHHITALDPIQTIMQLGNIGSNKLIEIYYDICGFNNLQLNSHPSFILLKDVLLNAQKYCDSQVYVSSNENNSHINQEAIGELSKILENINSHSEFNKYFKGNKDINACLSRVCNTFSTNYSSRYNLEPYREYNNLRNVISEFSKKQLIGIDEPSKVVKAYLHEWPIHYFNGKSYANTSRNNMELTVNANNDKKLKDIVKKYNLLGISFSKNIDASLIISIFEKFDSTVKTVFPIEDEHIGNNQIWFNFSSPKQQKRNENRTNIGFFTNTNIEKKFIDTCISSEDVEKSVSILVHEYTHFMQFNNEDSKKFSYESLDVLGKESYKWVEFKKEDFANFFLTNILKDFYFEPSFWDEHKDYLINSLTSAIDIYAPLEQFSEKFLSNIDKLLTSDEGNRMHRILGDVLPENRFLVGAYYITEQDKVCSYEYTLWSYYDRKGKSTYWIKPQEIHARFNQDLIADKTTQINKHVIINPKKLDAMKEMLQYFNNTYTDKLVSSNKKRSKPSI